MAGGFGLKVCPEPGCPELVEQGHCIGHRRQREQRRGSRQARGYDRAYELNRKQWEPKVASGKVNCWSCRERISPLDPWDNGHCDDDRSVIHGPQHVACNRDTSTAEPCLHASHAGRVISSGA